MFLNLAIILFVIFMAAFWLREGLFSAMLHLAAVIVAGALALAFWEPLAFMLLGMGNVGSYMAWGVGLLLPFGIFLILLRFAMDIFVPGNVEVPGIANIIGGGIMGLFSGILTAGLVVIGVGFLPLAPSIAGYEPYVIQSDGKVTPSGQSTWIPVASTTAWFYETVSGGSLHPLFGTSLAAATPQMDVQSDQFRLVRVYDPYASVIAPPTTVKATRLGVGNLPLEEDVLPRAVERVLKEHKDVSLQNKNNRLIAVELEFNNDARGAFDRDVTLRLPPAQVRLGGYGTGDIGLSPVAFSTQDPANLDKRTLTMVDDNGDIAYALTSANKVTMLFDVPQDYPADFVRVRQLRVPIEIPERITPETVARIPELLGLPEIEETVTTTTNEDSGDTEDPETPVNVDYVIISNDLPRMFSKNAAMGLSYSDTEPAAVTAGSDTTSKIDARMGKRNRVGKIHSPSHLVPIRVEIQPEQVDPMLSAARTAAAGDSGVYLADSNDNKYYPYAYVLDKEQEINVSMAPGGTTLRSASDLPVNRMGRDDKLYLYFLAPPGLRLTSLHVGDMTVRLDLATTKPESP